MVLKAGEGKRGEEEGDARSSDQTHSKNCRTDTTHYNLLVINPLIDQNHPRTSIVRATTIQSSKNNKNQTRQLAITTTMHCTKKPVNTCHLCTYFTVCYYWMHWVLYLQSVQSRIDGSERRGRVLLTHKYSTLRTSFERIPAGSLGSLAPTIQRSRVQATKLI